MVPCRMPSGLAGVVHGSCAVQERSWYSPPANQRRMWGTAPDWTAHCITGNGTPSSCTKSTPSTSGSGTGWGRRAARRVSEVTSPSSVPAVVAQEMRVPTNALTQVATNAVHGDESMPGTVLIATYMMSA
jgi:hypothetical protein